MTTQRTTVAVRAARRARVSVVARPSWARARALHLSALVVLLHGVVACSGPLQSAQSAFDRGDYDGARGHAEAALAAAPRDAAAHTLLAEVALAQGQVGEAIDHAQQGAWERSGDLQAQKVLARAYLAGDRLVSLCEPAAQLQKLDPASLAVLGDDPNATLTAAVVEAVNAAQPQLALACLAVLRAREPAAFSARHGEAQRAAVVMQARLLESEGRYYDAVAALEAADQDAPDSGTELALERGRLLLSVGDNDAARDALEAYVADDPGDGTRYRQAAALLASSGWDALAIDYLRQAVERAPAQHGWRLELARVALTDGDAETGKAALTAFLAPDRQPPPTPQEVLDAADMATTLGWVDLAIPALEAALQRTPGEMSLGFALATLHHRRGETGPMEQVLAAVVAAAPARGTAALLVADWLSERQYDASSLHFYKLAATEADAPADMFVRLARSYLLAKDFTAMERALTEHLQRQGGARDARVEAAEVALEGYSFARAVDFLVPAFDADPSDRQVAQLLAESYDGLGNRQAENNVYRRWVDASAEPARAALVVGALHAERGEDELAEAYLRSAFADPAVEAEARFQLADLFLRLGRGGEADAMFDAFIAASADPTAARSELFDFYRRTVGDEDRAVLVAERAIAEDPEAVELALELGRLRLERNERSEALRAFVAYCERSPDLAEAANVVRQEAHRWRQHGLAAELLQRLLERNPSAYALHRVAGENYLDHAAAVSLADPFLASTLRDRGEAEFWAFIEEAPAEASSALLRFATLMHSRLAYALAVAAFEKAGDDAIRSPEMWRVRAEDELRTGRTEAGQRSLRRMIDTSNGAATAQLEAARTLADTGNADLAVGYARDAAAGDHGEVGLQAYQLLADLLVVSGAVDELEAATANFLAHTTLPFEARQAAARAFLRSGQFERAMEAYEALLRQRPNALSVVTDIAALGILRGQPEQAERVLHEFVARSPTPSSTWRAIGDFYRERGELRLALEAYDAAAANAQLPDQDIVLAQGELHVLLGEFDAAAQAFERALSLPGDPEEKFRRVLAAYANAQRAEQADQMAARAMAELPRTGPFILFRVKHALAGGRPEVALQWADVYREGFYPLPPLVDLMLGEGSFEHARDLVVRELDRNERQAATAHVVALASRHVLYRGLDRTLRLLERFGFGARAPVNITRATATRLSLAGRTRDAAVLLGELQRVGEATAADRMLRAQLLVRAGAIDEAVRELQAWSLQGDERERVERHSRAAAVLVEADAVDAALQLLGRGLEHGLMGLLAPTVDVLVRSGRAPDALDLVRGGPLAVGFSKTISDEALAALVDACLRLGALGFAAEAAQLLAELETAQSGSALVARALVQALGSAGDAKALGAATDRFVATHKSAEHRLELAQTLADVGAPLPEGLLSDALGFRDDTLALAALRLAVSDAISRRSDVGAAVKVYLSGRFNRLRARMTAAAVLSSVGEYEAAAVLLRQSTQLAPTEPTVYASLADAAYLAGSFDEAAESVVAAAARRPDRVDTLVRAAMHFAEGPDSGVARRALDTALELRPFDGRLKLVLAEQAYLAGAETDGDHYADAFVAGSDDAVRAQGHVIRVLLEANQVDRAVARAASVVDGGPASEAALWQAGLAFLRAGDDARAVAAFEKAVAVSLGPLELQVAIAEAFRRAGRLGQAERFLEKAIAAEPDSPAPRLYRGLFRLQNGDVDGAAIEFDAAMSDGFDVVDTAAIAGEAALRAGADALAAQLLGRLLEVSGVDAETRVATVLQVYGAQARAGAGLELVAQRTPGLMRRASAHPQLAHAVCVALIRAGRPGEALQLAESTRHLNPSSAAAWDALARARLASDDLEGAAFAAIRGALAAKDEERARFLATVGRVRYAQGELAAAESIWLAALRQGGATQPRWVATVLQSLAHVAEQQGRDADAAHYLKRAQRELAGTVEPDAFD